MAQHQTAQHEVGEIVNGGAKVGHGSGGIVSLRAA